MKVIILILLYSLPVYLISQGSIKGRVSADSIIDFQFCKIGLKGSSKIIIPTSDGTFEFHHLEPKTYEIQCYCLDFQPEKKSVSLKAEQTAVIHFQMQKVQTELEEVQVLGTIKETNRAESPIITDIYDKKYFTKNPSASLIDVLDRMNGVRPQVNCNVCGTGDIHLNGLEGAYTLIILDGVPIVGGLSSVYGLSGIPSFMLDRIEVTKGPASSLYGSEALAGVIHAFSKKPSKKPGIYFQNFVTSNLENNTDLGINLKVGKKAAVFTSGNYFYFQHKIDRNKDRFTDVPLQNRFSIYQKWSLERKDMRLFNVSFRYMNEKRWGGETNWDRSFRGSDSIYAESIDLNRAEINVVYQLPLKEKLLFIGHYNYHHQDSYYGNTTYNALQQLGFFQLTWDKKFKKQQLLAGTNFRQTVYDDNTFLTQSNDSIPSNKVLSTSLPGIFIQHELKPKPKTTILLSARVDYYHVHGFIFTPRLALSQKMFKSSTFRIHAGNGFRVVNLFTEDHAALTGSRQVKLLEDLKPERSYSINSSYSVTKSFKEDWYFEYDLQFFYTYFTNRIVPDYLTDPNLIIYSNIKGYGLSYGSGLDVKLSKKNVFSLQIGFTALDVSLVENGVKNRQLLTEKWSGNWTISYSFKKLPLAIDYTGNVTSGMKLPLLSSTDPRPAYSKPYSIQNIQFTVTLKDKNALFFGVKNLFDWTPAKGVPFLIARSDDPFDKQVVFGDQGQVVPTTNNPYALTFDPSYVYAPNQGIRAFIGVRISLD